MAQQKPNPFVEWYLLAKEQIPALAERLSDWIEEARAEPAIIWQTPAVRYSVWLLCGLAAVWAAGMVVRVVAPGPPPGAQPRATTADFHVICTEPDCGQHFTAHRRLGFDRFPIVCPTCGRRSGFPARSCTMPDGSSRWLLPIEIDGTLRCPEAIREPPATGG